MPLQNPGLSLEKPGFLLYVPSPRQWPGIGRADVPLLNQPYTRMAEPIPMGNPELLLELLHYAMPFGKYKGHRLRDLPMAYLEWFAQKGFPPGKLGVLLQTLYEIRLNGLDYLLAELERQQRR